MDPLKIEDEMVRFSFEDEIDPLKIEDHEMDPLKNEDTMDLIMELSKKREEITRIDLRNWPNDGTLIVPDRTFFEPGRRVGIFESYWRTLEDEMMMNPPWRMPVKKAVLIGLKHPRINNTDVKEKILRLKAKLMELRGFTEDNITLMMEDQDDEEEKEPSRKSLQPTIFNIRGTLDSLFQIARPGDILYIHLIAYGCSDGRIITSDKYHIEDQFFRHLIVLACEGGYNLTLVSDCLIEPAVCSCKEHRLALFPSASFVGSDISFEEGRKKFMEFLQRKPERYFLDVKSVQPTNLSYVDILTTPNEEMKKDADDSYSGVILLTPFRPVQNAATIPNPFHNVSELFISPPNRLTNHTSYGVLTDAILDVFEETHGQFTYLGLAQKAMKKLGGGITPTLRCSDHNLAYTSFLC